MEVKIDQRHPVAAGVDAAWAVLGDVRAVAACMPGAQITEQLDETHFKGTVKSRIGPAVMSFAGSVELQRVDAGERLLRLLAKGADKAGSSASMQLEARLEPGETADTSVLVGQASVVVSGKLAQFGNRLLVPVSDAMLQQFAANFSRAAAAVPVAAAPSPGPAEALPDVTMPAAAATADGVTAMADAAAPAHGGAAADLPAAAPSAAAVAPAAGGGEAAAVAPAAAPGGTTAIAPGAALGEAAVGAPGHVGPDAALTPSPAAAASHSSTPKPPSSTVPPPSLPPPSASPRPAPTPAPAAGGELDAVGLLWTVFKRWLAGLFGGGKR